MHNKIPSRLGKMNIENNLDLGYHIDITKQQQPDKPKAPQTLIHIPVTEYGRRKQE
jgi:hypothetical protein